MDIVYLSASAKLLLNRLHDDAPVVLHYIGGDGLPVLRRLVDNGHIAYPAHCHVERTRNRSRRERQHIDSGEHLLEFLLVSHAETLLLVDYYKPEILEFDVVLNDTVRTYQDINAASLQPAEYLALLRRGLMPRKKRDIDREALHAVAAGLEMLPCKHGRGNKYRALLPVFGALESRPESDLCFAESNVAAQQPLHRNRLHHVRLYLVNTAELRISLNIVEVRFEILLKRIVRREFVPLALHAAGIKLDKLGRHLLCCRLRFRLGLLPLIGVQLV